MLILVTGCAGFIGSHLCESLLHGGYQVVGLDALTDYYDPGLKLRNLSRCLDFANFRFLRGAIADADRPPMEDAICNAGAILHLAAEPGVRVSWGSAFERYVTNNVLATQILLEKVRGSSNLKHFVYTSSSSVYGESAVGRVSEEYPTHPRSPYGVTKLAAEHLCRAYADAHDLPMTVLRLFTVCGPRQRPDMLFHRLIQCALTGAPFPLYGDAGMERDFTPVMDVVNVLLRAAATSTGQGVFNVANGQSVSIAQAIAMVEDLCGTRIVVEDREKCRGDVRRTSADISKAASLLNYQPITTLRDAVRLQIREQERLLSESGSASHMAPDEANDV